MQSNLQAYLQRDELGAVGHHVELGPDALVLGEHLWPGHPLQPPRLELEDGDAVSLGRGGQGVLAGGGQGQGRSGGVRHLAAVLVRHGEDPDHRVPVLPDQSVDVRGEGGLSDHGDPEGARHGCQ